GRGASGSAAASPVRGEASGGREADHTGVARSLPRRLRHAAVLAATALLVLAPAGSAAGYPRARACVYAAHSHRTMQRFERMVGRTLDCAVVFNNAAPNWHYWERPWFVSHNDPDLNWARWATAPHT